VWQVIGHEWAVELLQRSLARGKVSHAYLFVGPPQIGKSTLALEFARALNCTGDDPPCGECAACRKISKGAHPDVKVIEAQGGSIKIEQIRALRRDAALAPYEGRWKAYILPQMERATPEAANALLKTLEEPPSYVILMLITSNMDLLFPTIISRCQVLKLRLLPVTVVEEALRERWGVAPEQAHLLSRLSGGRIGWAVQAARNPALVEERTRYLDELEALLKGDKIQRLQYAEALAQNPDKARQALLLWQGWWRDLLLVKGGNSSHIVNVNREDSLQTWAQNYSWTQIHLALQALRATLERIERHANLRLALEILLLSLPILR